MLGSRWIRFYFLAQPGDMIINRARNRIAVISPNLVEEFIASYDFTSTPNQIAQDFEFAW